MSKTKFEIKKLSELPLDPLSLLLWGPAKSGKTHILGTLGKRLLIINVDGTGLNTLTNPTYLNKYPESKDVYTVSVNEVLKGYVPESPEAFDNVKTVMEQAVIELKDEIDSVAIDSASSWHRLAIFKAFEINQVMMPAGNAEARAKNLNAMVPTVNEYRVAMELMLQAVVGCQDLCKNHNKNFILTAHERRVYTERSKIGESLKLDKIMPWFQGVEKNPDGIAGLFDLVWHTEVFGNANKVEHVVRIAGDDARTVGMRFQGVFKDNKGEPNVIIKNPNLKDLFNQINSARKEGIKTMVTFNSTV